ncbi:MAG: PAS domain-containing sensor histidine kinase [Syntrophales bacterium]
MAEAILKLVAVRAAGELERRQVEEERYQSERHYRLLHETMLQGVVYQDAKGKVISMNPAAVQILGKSPDEYLDHALENVEHPTLRGDGSLFPGLDHPSMMALRTGQELRDVVMGVYNPRERDYRWINVRAMPRVGPGEGKPDQVYIMFDDITESRRIETVLQDSEVRYRRLFEAAQDGILIVDAETGQIADVNPFLMDMLNYSKEEFTGKKLWEIGAFKDIEKSKFAFAELQNSQYIRFENLQLETQDGRLIDVEFVSNVYLVDHTKVVQCNIRDITERRRAERRQSLAAEVLGIINDSLPLADTINRILTAIKKETRFEAVGIRLRSGDDFPYSVQNGFSNDFLLAENTLAVRARDGGVCRDENGNIGLECTCGLVISGRTDPTNHLYTQGGSFWINDSLPLLDQPADQDPRLNPRNRCVREGFRSVALIPIRADREIVGLLQLNDRKKGRFTLDMITFFEGLGSSIGIAITRKRVEEALKEQTAQLEAANKELESFSYSISHDLRAPLRAIAGYTKMLLRTHEEKFDEEIKHKFHVIMTNVHKMEQLIEDLLAFARVGRRALSLSVLDMEELVKEVWHEQITSNPDRRMELKNSTLPQAFGDRTLIRQVLFNLLSNAVKFTKNRDAALIEVGGKSDGRENVYFVKDNGAGFDMKYYDKLFGVFQRLHSDSEYEGTGVGLAIVKQGINRHGGRVWGEGTENIGATFYFSLPHERR